MAKIEVMSQHLANMIAAGEVIERPSSVIKELVENSIDANSTHIEVDIFNAGRDKIIVKDDGEGMDKDDALVAFTRHASSKLKDEYQLFKIKTMGFRGEALPSIASVSKVTMITSTGVGAGSKVKIENENLSREDAPSLKGTTFEVEELFYNTPVRLKYLKSDYTEVASCLEVMQRFALSHPEIAFDFFIDGKVSFSTSGRGDLLEVIARLYGSDVAKKMIKIESEGLGYSLKGYIAKPEVTRATKYYMITFVNNRNVYIPNVQKAIINGYSDYIFNSKYPFVVLNLDVEYSLVDVNVHPSKKEVRMSNDQEIAQEVERLIKEELNKLNAIHDVYVPTNKVETVSLFNESKMQLDDYIMDRPMSSKPTIQPVIKEEPVVNTNYDLSIFDDDNLFDAQEEKKIEEVKVEEKVEIEEQKTNIPEFRVVGQILKTYIVLEGNDGFYLCDQHAANERINYEKFNEILNSKIDISPLLVPLIITLSPSDIAKLTPKKLELLANVGLEIEPFGLNTIKINEIPLFIKEANEEAYINEMIDQVIRNDKIDLESLRKHIIATMACKASIKANDELTLIEMNDLIKQLFKCKNPTCCPHGRPTIIHFTKYDVEKMFKRTGF